MMSTDVQEIQKIETVSSKEEEGDEISSSGLGSSLVTEESHLSLITAYCLSLAAQGEGSCEKKHFLNRDLDFNFTLL
jgi:hypothetical protein